MEIIHKYFPKLTDLQVQQFEQLAPLYTDWNSKINVISRKDIDNLYPHHILHSLSIAKFINFKSGSSILDLGTGGGFPGIPLAILFPAVKFTLVDGTRKKITVVEDVINQLELKNAVAKPVRAEEMKDRFDFVVTRAVASLDKLIPWSFPKLKRMGQNGTPNGLIALKGSNVEKELKVLPNKVYSEIYPLADYFQEAYFETKCLIYIQG